MADQGFFHQFIENHRQRGELILQSRVGFSELLAMRRGLEAVAAVDAPTIGTITVDSKTRTGDLEGVRRALDQGQRLNGYPIATYSVAENRRLIQGLHGPRFPIQVRHGSARPEAIFRATMECGLEATEGGPISYCLPYSRTPLETSIATWGRCSRSLASLEQKGIAPHVESFGGCMMGQLCPPALLVAITILECVFFSRKGLRSVSLSYAQGTNSPQDIGALLALRRLAGQHLSDVTWHVVVYTFMGLFPQTAEGAVRLLEESVRITRSARCERLIVKTVTEAHRIPEIERNLEALEIAARCAAEPLTETSSPEVLWHQEVIEEQAGYIVSAVLDLDPSIDRAIAIAFSRGHLDVPYCLHPDNRNEARAAIGRNGVVEWLSPGKIPLPSGAERALRRFGGSQESGSLLAALSFNQNRYDELAARCPRPSKPTNR